MELNFLKWDIIQTVQPNEPKCATYDIGYFVMQYVYFGE